MLVYYGDIAGVEDVTRRLRQQSLHGSDGQPQPVPNFDQQRIGLVLGEIPANP
jgi:hypothetical protein